MSLSAKLNWLPREPTDYPETSEATAAAYRDAFR